MTQLIRRPPLAASRREVLRGGLAALAAPALAAPALIGPALIGFGGRAFAAGSASRSFDVLRDGASIGAQTTSVSADGAKVEVKVKVRIAVKMLGIVAYRYTLDSHEIWENGLLTSLDGTTDDDGSKEVARVRREGDKLIASGTHKGEIPGDAATTTYWTPEFLDRSTWISTQTGAPLDVTIARDGTESVPGPSGRLDCARWRVAGDLKLTLYYDDRGEWMGNAFDAGGELARFRATAEGPRLAALWPKG